LKALFRNTKTLVARTLVLESDPTAPRNDYEPLVDFQSDGSVRNAFGTPICVHRFYLSPTGVKIEWLIDGEVFDQIIVSP